MEGLDMCSYCEKFEELREAEKTIRKFKYIIFFLCADILLLSSIIFINLF